MIQISMPLNRSSPRELKLAARGVVGMMLVRESPRGLKPAARGVADRFLMVAALEDYR